MKGFLFLKCGQFFDDFYFNVKVGFFSKSSLENFTNPIRVRLISNFGVQNVYNTIAKRTEVVSLLNFPDFVFKVAQVKIVVCPLGTNCIDLMVNFWVGKKKLFFSNVGLEKLKIVIGKVTNENTTN